MPPPEKANIEAALKQTEWKIYGTGGETELLGIKPTTLLSRIKKKEIEKLHNDSEFCVGKAVFSLSRLYAEIFVLLYESDNFSSVSNQPHY